MILSEYNHSYFYSKVIVKRHSNKEKEVRLTELEKKPKKMKDTFKRASTLHATNFTKQSKPGKSKLAKPEPPPPAIQKDSESEGDDEESADAGGEATDKRKSKSSRYSKFSTKSKSILVTETSEGAVMAKKFPRIMKIRNSKWYQLAYFICYYFLALNDHFRLLILQKGQDNIFLGFSIFFILLFLIDIITRAVVEPGYFFRFFFFVDCISMVIIIGSLMVTNVSFYVVLSFLKTIMIVRVTDIVVRYKKWQRKRLVDHVSINILYTFRHLNRDVRMKREKRLKKIQGTSLYKF